MMILSSLLFVFVIIAVPIVSMLMQYPGTILNQWNHGLLAWGNGSFEKAGLSPGINQIYLSLKSTDEIVDLDEKLNELADTYNDLEANCQFSITEHYQQTEQFRILRKILNTSYIFIILIIIFFAVISSIITLQVRIEQQRKALV